MRLLIFKHEGILNVALTNDKSSWTGVAAHEKYKTDKHQYGYDMHDVGEFNLYLQNGAIWTNEQQSHVTTTTMADKNPIWDGSTWQASTAAVMRLMQEISSKGTAKT